jgi:CPA2 family monovalent cation:H+ antiporter-2
VDLADALVALGGAFLLAGLLARAGARIGLPTIPLFMLAGVVLGPNTPGIELFSEAEDLKVLAALGLIFLLFYLGLEFDVEELTGGGQKLALAGGAYIVLNFGGGLLFGLALGWGFGEALVIAGVIGISSSAIVSKVLVELGRLRNRETPLLLGIIVVEDVFLAFYLALLQPVLGGASGTVAVATEFGTAFAFLLALAAVARWGGRYVAKLVDSHDDELLIVCFIGLAVLTAGVAEELGVSDAIGAFMVGLILGTSPVATRIKHFVHPLRDAFGALFFFAFGLSIAPAAVADVALPVIAAAVLTLVLNIAAGAYAARLHSYDREAAANIGFTVLARGEFALVLASLAAAAALDPRISAFVAGYVLILAVLGPLLASRSKSLAGLVPIRMVEPEAASA